MKINLLTILFATMLLLVLSSNSAYSQRGVAKEYASPLDPSAKATPIYIGPAFGYNHLGHSMTIPTFTNDPTGECKEFKNASGPGFFGGFTVEYLFGEVESSSSSLIFRALFNTYGGTNKVREETYPILHPDDFPIDQDCESIMDISYNAATFEVMYKINPIPAMGLGIIVGPAFDFILTRNRTHDFDLVEPKNGKFSEKTKNDFPDAEFLNFDRTIRFYDGEIEEALGFRLGLKVGVQYEILLGSKLYIAPSLAYNFGITSVSSL